MNGRFRSGSVAANPALLSEVKEELETSVLLSPSNTEVRSSFSNPLALQQNITAAEFKINPFDVRKWSDKDDDEFDNLAFKRATTGLSSEQEVVLQKLLSARRRDLPKHTAEQVMLTAEHNQLLNEMQELLQKFHAFRLRLGPNHEV